MSDTNSDGNVAIANTGTNDSDSMWASGLLQTALQDGLQIGSIVLSNAVQTPVTGSSNGTGLPAKQVIPANSAAAGIPPLSSDWKFWLFGGVILVAAAWLLTRKA